MKLSRQKLMTLSGLCGILVLLWGLVPAWQLWRSYGSLMDQLSRQRLEMLQQQQEAQSLKQKPLALPPELTQQIGAISKQRFGAVPTALPGAALQIQLNAVRPEQLALGWQEIRSQQLASLTQADLTQGPQGWSGTLVFKLPQKP